MQTLEEIRSEAEYNHIIAALKAYNNNKSKAAVKLNIDRKTLYNKIKQYERIKAKNTEVILESDNIA